MSGSAPTSVRRLVSPYERSICSRSWPMLASRWWLPTQPAVVEVDERRRRAGTADVAVGAHGAERDVEPEAALAADAVLALGQQRAAARVTGGRQGRAGESQQQDDGEGGWGRIGGCSRQPSTRRTNGTDGTTDERTKLRRTDADVRISRIRLLRSRIRCAGPRLHVRPREGVALQEQHEAPPAHGSVSVPAAKPRPPDPHDLVAKTGE